MRELSYGIESMSVTKEHFVLYFLELFIVFIINWANFDKDYTYYVLHKSTIFENSIWNILGSISF